MNITNIKFRIPKHPINNIQATATITFDNQFMLHGVRVICTDHKGWFIDMPYYEGKNGMKFSTFHPINNEARKEMEDHVLDAYSEWAVDQDEWAD